MVGKWDTVRPYLLDFWPRLPAQHSVGAWASWLHSVLREGEVGADVAEIPPLHRRWEPVNIALASFYALGLQSALDQTIAAFRSGAEDSSYLKATIIVQLATFTTWFTMTFLESIWVWSALADRPRLRFIVFSVLSTTFVLFYFLGSLIGGVTKSTYLIVSLILASELLLVPLLRRGGALPLESTIRKFRRRAGELIVAIAGILFLAPQLWVAWAFAVLIGLQALVYENRSLRLD